MAPPWSDPAWILQSRHMVHSFRKLVGYDLLANRTESSSDRTPAWPCVEESGVWIAQRLFELDAIVLAHGTEDDPVFCYGNQAALNLWEVDLPTLLSMPSRRSAEPVERTSRARMLDQGLENGFIADYEGIRISSTGRRFHIRNAVIWNVMDDTGVRIGQAATFRDWEYTT